MKREEFVKQYNKWKERRVKINMYLELKGGATVWVSTPELGNRVLFLFEGKIYKGFIPYSLIKEVK
jgi:hypothetical protein